MREHADRARRPQRRARLDEIAHAVLERLIGIAEVIASPVPRERGSLRRPEPAPSKHPGQLAEVEVDHEEWELEGVLDRASAPVVNAAHVEAAVHLSPPRRVARRPRARCAPHPMW